MHVNVKHCNFNSSLPRLDVLAHSKKYQPLLNRIVWRKTSLSLLKQMSVLLIIEHIRMLLCFRHHRAVAPSLLVTCRCCITNRKGKKEPIHVRNSAVIILQFILKIKTWQKHWERRRVEVQLQQCQQVIRSLARRKQQHCMSTSTLLMQATCQVPKRLSSVATAP